MTNLLSLHGFTLLLVTFAWLYCSVKFAEDLAEGVLTVLLEVEYTI